MGASVKQRKPMETEVWKMKYGSEKKSHLLVSSALLTQLRLVNTQRVTVSKWCENRAPTHTSDSNEYQHSRLAWNRECSLVMVSFRDYGNYFLVSLEDYCSWLSHLWSTFVAGWAIGKDSLQRTMTTLASASLSREPRSIEPTWLAHSSLVLVWVWLPHALWYQQQCLLQS